MDSIDAWQRMCEELGEEDLVLPDADVAFTFWHPQKTVQRTGGPLRLHWGRWVLYILEFTRPNDWADDLQTRTDAYKTELYTQLWPSWTE